MKKIFSTKAKKTETSEQGDAHFKVVLPKPLSRNRRELDGATESEGRRQGHNTRPDDGVSFLQRLNPSLNAPFTSKEPSRLVITLSLSTL
jgi:hypothetical protein